MFETNKGATTSIRIGEAQVDFVALSIDGLAGRASIEPKVTAVTKACHGRYPCYDAPLARFAAAISIALALVYFASADKPAVLPKPAQKSIAVLPFSDLSSEGNQQYLSDGLAEEILNAPVQFPDLRVSGRSSSFNFRDKDLDLQTINATPGGVAREIARNLGLVLDLPAQKRFAPRLTDNREAYELFLQGRLLVRQFGQCNKTKARELLERAIDLDPGFATVWAWLSQAHIYLTLTVGSADIPGHIASAQYAVERALMLDPNLPLLAHRRGYSRLVIGRSRESVRLMKEAPGWDPTDAVGLLNLGVGQRAAGQLGEADASFHRSYDLGFEPTAVQLCNTLILRQTIEAARVCWNNLSDDFRSRYQPLLQAPLSWSIVADAHVGGDITAQQKVRAALDNYFEKSGSHASSYLMHVYLSIGAPKRFYGDIPEQNPTHLMRAPSPVFGMTWSPAADCANTRISPLSSNASAW